MRLTEWHAIHIYKNRNKNKNLIPTKMLKVPYQETPSETQNFHYNKTQSTGNTVLVKFINKISQRNWTKSQ